MSKYMCLSEGQSFENKKEASEHVETVHGLSFEEAIRRQKSLIKLDEDDDPEDVYQDFIESSK